MGVEVVVAGSRLRDFPSVSVDDVAIGRMAVEHLVGLGHTRIGMIRTSDTDGAKWASDRHRRDRLPRGPARGTACPTTPRSS